MSRLKVNSVTNRLNDGPPELTNGVIVPVGAIITSSGNLNLSGIATIGIVSSTSINVSGVVTATSFVGNGSGITGLSVISQSRAIALKIIFDPLPFRT